MSRAAAVRTRTDRAALEQGSAVRLLVKRTREGSKAGKFTKANEARWTKETYTVLDRAGPNSYRIDAPPGETDIWPIHTLLPAGRATVPQGPSIDKRVVSAQRREALNISPQENLAALAAPAREKRERRAPVKLDL